VYFNLAVLCLEAYPCKVRLVLQIVNDDAVDLCIEGLNEVFEQVVRKRSWVLFALETMTDGPRLGRADDNRYKPLLVAVSNDYDWNHVVLIQPDHFHLHSDHWVHPLGS